MKKLEIILDAVIWCCGVYFLWTLPGPRWPILVGAAIGVLAALIGLLRKD